MVALDQQDTHIAEGKGTLFSAYYGHYTHLMKLHAALHQPIQVTHTHPHTGPRALKSIEEI
jgi:hypothetical protein